ncbi:MAG TPA: DUF4124 domain-containing protein [Steroidobacteraceae bacterium]|nr:DUF4124 domain-containing protein [Steroidobacteraceae bacterium]
MIGLIGVANADVYRWVDDKGEPHYSDKWVPGSQLIKSNRPHPQDSTAPSASDQPKLTPAGEQKIADKLAQEQNQRAVDKDVATVRDGQCKQAKERYQKAIQARRLYKTTDNNPDGERTYMTDEEADAYRAQARKDVTDACGTPPPPAAE